MNRRSLLVIILSVGAFLFWLRRPPSAPLYDTTAQKTLRKTSSLPTPPPQTKKKSSVDKQPLASSTASVTPSVATPSSSWQEKFRRLYPQRDLSFSEDIVDNRRFVSGLDADVAGENAIAKARTLLERHADLLERLPPGVELDHFSEKSTPAGAVVVATLFYQGYEYPGTQVVYFDSEGKVRSISDGAIPLKSVDLCDKLSEEEVRGFIRSINPKASQISLSAKKLIHPSSGSRGVIVWPVEFSLPSQAGPIRYQARVSGCRQEFETYPLPLAHH